MSGNLQLLIPVVITIFMRLLLVVWTCKKNPSIGDVNYRYTILDPSPVLRSRHIFGRLRELEVLEPTPARQI